MPTSEGSQPAENGTAEFISATRLRDNGPRAFLRAIERLLHYLGFDDIRNIDASGDMGGDLLAHGPGGRWVFQSRWTRGKTISARAVHEVDNARIFYKARRAVVVTNARPSRSAEAQRSRLLSVGAKVEFWDNDALEKFSLFIPSYVKNQLTPYDFQARSIDAAEQALENGGKAFVVLATGLGKTVVAGQVVDRFTRASPTASVLVVAHTRELVYQLERALWRHLPKTMPTAILTGDSRPEDLDGVIFATVDSALSAVVGGWTPKLVVVDEAHHVGEQGTFQRLLSELEEVPRLGLTATPWRGDRYDVRAVFGPPVFTMGIAEGIAQGYLSQVDYRLFLDEIDWAAVQEVSEHGRTISDLNERLFLPERDEAIATALRRAWSRIENPRGIVFCRTIDHAEEFARVLRTSGWPQSECINSRQRKRDRNLLMSDFRDGVVPIVTTVDLFNEGVDIPDVNIICFLRVTHSRRIFVQQLGRGLRLSRGKGRVVVLDFVSDIRRVKAALDLKRALDHTPTTEIERIALRSTVEFTNPRIGTFLDEWLEDAAALEDSPDHVRLDFPEVPARHV